MRKKTEDYAADVVVVAAKVGWKAAKFVGRVARRVAGRAAVAAAESKPAQVAVEMTQALLEPREPEPFIDPKLRIIREPHLEAQMAKDVREGKGCMFGFMFIIAVLLFTTTSFAGLPFAGGIGAGLALVVALGYVLTPAKAHVWYWRHFDKSQYLKAKRAAEGHLLTRIPPAARQRTEFKFSCPHCGQHISVTTDYVGRHGTCPTCNNELTVPCPSA